MKWYENKAHNYDSRFESYHNFKSIVQNNYCCKKNISIFFVYLPWKINIIKLLY